MKSCPDDAYISTLATPVSDLACSTCLKGCDAGEYLEGTCGGTSNKECKDCHPTCQTCSGPTATQCLTCPGTLAFQDGECKTDCDDGQVNIFGFPSYSHYISIKAATSASIVIPLARLAAVPMIARAVKLAFLILVLVVVSGLVLRTILLYHHRNCASSAPFVA